MDSFEENLQTFNSTIYGAEMRDSLYRCLDLIYSEIQFYDKKIRESSDKIRELEGRD